MAEARTRNPKKREEERKRKKLEEILAKIRNGETLSPDEQSLWDSETNKNPTDPESTPDTGTPDFDDPEQGSTAKAPEPTPITPYDSRYAPGYVFDGQGGIDYNRYTYEGDDLDDEDLQNIAAMHENSAAARATAQVNEVGGYDTGDGMIQVGSTVGTGGKVFPKERKRTAEERRAHNKKVSAAEEQAKQAQKLNNRISNMMGGQDLEDFKKWFNEGVSNNPDGPLGKYVNGGADRLLAEDKMKALSLYETYKNQRITGAVNKEEERIQKEGLDGYTKEELEAEMKKDGWTYHGDEDGLKLISPDQNQTNAEEGNYPSFKDFDTARMSGTWGPWEDSNAYPDGGFVNGRPVYRKKPGTLAPGEVDPFPDPFDTPGINKGLEEGILERKPDGTVGYSQKGLQGAIDRNLQRQLEIAKKIQDKLNPPVNPFDLYGRTIPKPEVNPFDLYGKLPSQIEGSFEQDQSNSRNTPPSSPGNAPPSQIAGSFEQDKLNSRNTPPTPPDVDTGRDSRYQLPSYDSPAPVPAPAQPQASTTAPAQPQASTTAPDKFQQAMEMAAGNPFNEGILANPPPTTRDSRYQTPSYTPTENTSSPLPLPQNLPRIEYKTPMERYQDNPFNQGVLADEEEEERRRRGIPSIGPNYF